MTNRVYNFSAGPSTLPTEVLTKAQFELLSLNGTGRSVIEISHRSDDFEAILARAKQGVRDLLQIPDNYQVLFMQGGASLQFAQVPMTFLAQEKSADYIMNGAWSEKAVEDAKKFGNVNLVFSSKESGYKSTPKQADLRLSPNAEYVHYCSNETIEGVEFKYDLDGGNVPVICDASSNILSKPIDLSKYSMIYAGAQKNIGPSGVTLVIIRDDLIEKVPANLPTMLDYRHSAENGSMPNTPNTWAIYLISLVCEWLTAKGGVAEMAKNNERKAQVLYQAIDASDGFYRGHAERASRSLMNVTFRLSSAELERKFVAEATAAGFDGLGGHRSVGGIRASIYNAFPVVGVEKLVEFMEDFAQHNG